MPEGRPTIPAELKREILVEAGHRCAIQTCRQFPVQIDHIYDWATVKVHKAENLIALCANCHARKTNGEIDRKSLLKYKARLKRVAHGDLRLAAEPPNPEVETSAAKRIMIIDDDPTTRRLIEHVLKGDGFAIFGYENGREALRQLRRANPDLIITDLKMPKLGGEEFCRRVRKDDRFAKVPILVLTAADTRTDRYALFGIGAEDYIVKPFDALELLYRVRVFLRLAR